ncbi:MAG: caspase family protein [Campylobacterota bacterium]|nr:caspase family protein [Campylobacterota bacterium]
MKLFTLFLLLLSLLHAQPREALIIANHDYKYITVLDDPSSHVGRLEKSLTALGFHVQIKSNLNSEHLEESIEQFRYRLSKDRSTIGFLYYTGHGCQLEHRGYLIPTNVDTQKRLKIKHHALRIDEMLETIDAANNRVNMLFLDACRDVPTGAKGGTKGLGQLITPKGTLVVYATEAGKIARDNQNFINALIENIKQPNQSIRDMGFNISDDVSNKTNETQIPVVFAKRVPSVVLNVQKEDQIDNIQNTKPAKSTTTGLLKKREVEEERTPVITTNNKYTLTINPTPSHATVKIMNIVPAYYDGIALKQGKYVLRILLKGYKTKEFTINLKKDSHYDIVLSKLAKAPKVTSNSKWITPSHSICKANGGKIYKGVCEASWQDAKKICRASGGRLPSRADLHSVISSCGGIADADNSAEWSKNRENKSYQSCYKRKGFSDNAWYWTRREGDSSSAWGVYFGFCEEGWRYKSSRYYALCVR